VLSIVINGLVAGSLAALNSIGFILLWRTSRVVNLAQPALGLVGGVLTGMLFVSAGWGFWWAAPAGLLLGVVLSIGAERLVLSRLQEVPRSVLLLATVGLAQVFGSMHTAIPFIFGGRAPTYSLDLGINVLVGGSHALLGSEILAVLTLPLVAVGVHLFLAKTRLGIAALSLGQDAERARALGVPAGLVRTAVWGIAGLIASISGILAIPVLGYGLEGGALAPNVLLFALAPAVFGGLRSIWIAVASALGLGLAYHTAVWFSDGGHIPEVVLAVAVVSAVALQRKRLGRDEASARASSWESAATPRPLPWRVAASARVYSLGVVLAVAAVLAAAIPPLLFLSPGGDLVLYGTAAAFGLGAMGAAAAWMFAGELPLGHWGFAGLGAALAAVTPGPWHVRVAIAGLSIGLLNGVIALLTRRRSALAFAVAGLAAAAVAPAAILYVGRGTIPGVNTRVIGAVAGVLVVLGAILLIRVRASTFGTGLVAARDDPQRAPWLGVNPTVGRVFGLTLSGVMVGAAGALYVASTGRSGIAEGSFEPEKSLALLAIAVVGGLGSPVGVLFAAIALTGAERVLPPPWNGLMSGVGVIAVVMLLPAGLARAVERIRDIGVRMIGAAEPPQPTEAPAVSRQEATA